MNERIRELANQAGAEVKIIHGDMLYISKADLDLEKFAELIVRNCIVDFYRNYLDTTSDEDITKQVDRYVKQQFGVEE
jgi:hypothetical protein